MKLFKNLFHVQETKEVCPEMQDCDIVAVASGKMIPPSQIEDPVFAQEMMGQTIAIRPMEGTIVAPANGCLETVFETGHAFSVRMKDGTGLLVHIGIDTVSMAGRGFQILEKSGSTVKAGQPIVKVDLDLVRKEGKSDVVMLIVAEPAQANEKITCLELKHVTHGQKINQ